MSTASHFSNAPEEPIDLERQAAAAVFYPFDPNRDRIASSEVLSFVRNHYQKIFERQSWSAVRGSNLRQDLKDAVTVAAAQTNVEEMLSRTRTRWLPLLERTRKDLDDDMKNHKRCHRFFTRKASRDLHAKLIQDLKRMVTKADDDIALHAHLVELLEAKQREAGRR